MPFCIFCGASITVEPGVRIGRQEECPQCRRDLHACLQCRLYDRSAHNQCRESQSGYVTDKERANFCEFFTFGREDVTPGKDPAVEAKQKLEALFKK